MFFDIWAEIPPKATSFVLKLVRSALLFQHPNQICNRFRNTLMYRTQNAYSKQWSSLLKSAMVCVEVDLTKSSRIC
jgi:hypothetical protein